MKFRKRIVAVLCGGAWLASVAAGIWIHTALAGGGSSDPPLYYSGMLTDQGSPANGSYQVGINLRSTADTSSDANKLCTTAPVAVNASAGLFQVPLDDTCKAVLQGTLTAFYEVIVNGTSLGAAQAGAVPFAESAIVASRIQRAANGQDPSGGTATTHTSGPSYCGSTAPTNGAFHATDSAGHAWTGVAAAKELCRSACGGSLTAHLCSQTELKAFKDAVGLPAAVPGDGWILTDAFNAGGNNTTINGPCTFPNWSIGSCTPDLTEPYTAANAKIAGCMYSQAGAQYTISGENRGATYGPSGTSTGPTCDQQLPIHCCE
ncbi:MAG TPA: hypothetical protein VHC69_09050 [Polyangiaceae bacterium]|nr:hypothetical protein [Polyangiaceae bacterium]